MATERTVFLELPGGRVNLRMQPERQVSVPWCVVHDAEAVNDRCWEAIWQSGERKFGSCDVQDGRVWRVDFGNTWRSGGVSCDAG